MAIGKRTSEHGICRVSGGEYATLGSQPHPSFDIKSSSLPADIISDELVNGHQPKHLRLIAGGRAFTGRTGNACGRGHGTMKANDITSKDVR